jgi:hypothetical protein
MYRNISGLYRVSRYCAQKILKRCCDPSDLSPQMQGVNPSALLLVEIHNHLDGVAGEREVIGYLPHVILIGCA